MIRVRRGRDTCVLGAAECSTRTFPWIQAGYHEVVEANLTSLELYLIIHLLRSAYLTLITYSAVPTPFAFIKGKEPRGLSQSIHE